ncbi:MAG: hypothetical protein K2M60_07400 [Lachnospiraceae bacterium]|nr:hypothetical protein [Lachnospiraceae bacterium]MDE6254046.1 hypothetical protein [Lachnospiraceae bacterium]
MKKEKGKYGYLNYKKIYQLIMTLICLLVVLAVMVGGYLYYKTLSNICTVIAIVIVIPAAKFGVGYIVLFPYKAPEKKRYDELESSDYILLSELVITSEEKIMNLDFAAVKDKRAYCFVSNKKTEPHEIEKYLKKILNSEFEGVGVKVFTDYEKYKSALDKFSFLENNIRDKRISELLCVYSM